MRKNYFKHLYLLTLALVLNSFNSSEAKVVLPSIFTDNLVLQQKSNTLIWGSAEIGKSISIKTSWNNKEYKSIADKNGEWEIKVNTPSYGGPYSIQISDGDVTQLNNILIGEVWLCSGQSNMEMPLAGWGQVINYEKEISEANYPQIRLLQAKKNTSNSPLLNVELDNAGWQECAPESVSNFSAVAYFFAREIYKKTGIPIGLIHTSWGGTVAQAWVSGPSLETMPDFVDAVNQIEQTGGAAKEGEKQEPNRATVLFNAMIHPFIKYNIKGAIWYQGESNANKAAQYQTLFPLLIKDWRKQWNNNHLPFYFVQLANFMDKDEQPAFKSDWAELREAQYKTLSLANTGMAVSIDIGDAKDIHPKNKQEVGRRLALIALNKNYKQKNVYSGPLLKSYKIKGNKVSLTFDHADGLQAKGQNALSGFAVAGEDNKFYWADAVIEGNTVVVTSKEVLNPVHIRYGWGNNPECNLYNGADLPAAPFRTDKL